MTWLVFLMLAGPGFLWLGIRQLRTRAWRDGVPAIELLFDRAVGVDPPPRTDADRAWAHAHGWMMVIFGIFFSLCLAASLIVLISE